ncbi:MAG: glycoside hydrolase family 9 protein [Butyrivibrio sp.]|nr:glycoside hydrolase family 9 protein [Butyrivibrio sp.]
MKNTKMISGLVAALMLVPATAFSLTGCNKATPSVKTETTVLEQETHKADPAPNVVYEIPTVVPRTLVDQNGYRTGAEKSVVFRGENLPEVFYVFNMDTNELEYTGQIRENTFDAESGEPTGIGYFTDMTTDGNYYIYTDTLGSSYSFNIKNDLYDNIFNEACRTYYLNRCGMNLSEGLAGEKAHAACHVKEAHLQEDSSKTLDVTGGWHLNAQADRDAVQGCKIAQNLLLSYEMNPESIGDESGIPESGNGIPDLLDEIKYEIDWLMKMQDERTGGVYGAALTVRDGSDLLESDVEVTPITMEATIRFAALLADFSYQYQSFDPEYATTCLKCADRAYSLFVNTEDISSSSLGFHAAAQLYRATGASSYETVLTSFFGKSDFSTLFNDDEDVFLGGVVYISTSQKVNVDTCSMIMKLLMKKASKVANDARASAYLVTDEKDHAKILDDMRTITITDHIIYNYEYTTIIENHAHFLMGRNPEAVNYVTDTTEHTFLDTDEGTGIMNQPLLNAKFIFMVSVIKE